VALHHHVRRNTVTDWARLGRFLSGTATGLVLSGGAAKGIAHIGVIRALEEAGIPIDFLGGTSMGALMGAGRAHDWSGEKMRQVARPVFLSKPTSDLNLFPRVSLFKGAKMESVLQKLFGETQIEDLWLNFFAVSCNLTQKRPHIHRTGRLGDALRASISIPGAFPPKTIGGERFVDGGVFNNMPIDVMATFGVGTLMAVDLRDYDSAQKPSTGLLSVIVEASMVAGQYLAAQNSPQVDLLFNPPTGGVGMLEWGKFDTIEQVGYEHAREVLLNSYPKPTQS
jgi:predicted acylesterase/phospholipase RssA